MHIDTAGTYTLQYTAVDSCGNETIEERTVEVVTLKTTLFTDGTFIINEKSSDRDANIALHGAVTNEYIPFDPNGSTDAEKYIFTAFSQLPWKGEYAQVLRAEVGSPITPTSMAWWFSYFSNMETCDLSNVDGSANRSLDHTYAQCSNLKNIIFGNSWSTNNCASMRAAFWNCVALETIDTVSSIVCTEITGDLYQTFNNCDSLTTLDLSTWDTSGVNNTRDMFMSCDNLETIYASPLFVMDSVTTSQSMFMACYNLVGGAGTVYNNSIVDKTYAHIDGGTADPGYFTARA